MEHNFLEFVNLLIKGKSKIFNLKINLLGKVRIKVVLTPLPEYSRNLL